jgi:hypothetical protein
MVALSIVVQGADKLAAGMGKAAGTVLPTETRRAMDAALLLIEGDARRLVKQDTRRLMNSIHPKVTGSGGNLTGEVGPSLRYGLWVERGRPAGRRPPPVAALRGWASRHGIPVGALYVVARKIGQKGIPPAPFMQPAYEKNRGKITDLFARIGIKVVEAARG